MKQNETIGSRINPAYKRAMEDIAEETNDKLSYHTRQAVKLYIKSFDGIINDDIIDQIDAELDLYINARAEENLLEMANKRANVELRKQTTIAHLDGMLADMFYNLNRHDRLEDSEIAKRLKMVAKTFTNRAEYVDETEALEKRIEQPLKYAQKEMSKRFENGYYDS